MTSIGLLDKHADPSDRRAVTLTLTARELDLRRTYVEEYHAHLGDVLAETTAVPVPRPQPIRRASGRIRPHPGTGNQGKDTVSTSTARLPRGGKEPVATKLVIVVVSLAILTFLGILSETSLNNAYSTLMEEFSISASVVQCLTTGYLLLLSVSIPSSPFMVRKFATKTLFIMAIAIFTAGTVLGALALLPGAVLGAVSAPVVGGMLKRHSVSDHCGSAAAGRVACHMADGSPDQRPAHR
jgi:hypothetical protein